MTRLAVALVVVLGAAGCARGSSDVAAPATTAAGRETRVALRWEEVARFDGLGDRRTGPFDVAPGALQWRVTLSCTGAGSVRASIPADPEPLVEATCPTRAFGFSIRTGSNALDVRGTAAWDLVVDQQLDTPIAEPSLPGMAARHRLANGDFYGIEQEGSGTATLYRLPDGRRALRLDPFRVTANTDLVVWASGAAAPRTSAAALEAPHVQLAELKATAGTQNYLVPDDVPADLLRSIVVWCVPVRVAYAAAPLQG